MEEFLNNLRQNSSLFYFLIIFCVLWGGGMLWGVVVVIKYLRKKTECVGSLKRLGFVRADDNRGIMLQVRDISMKTIWRDFSSRVDEHPRKDLLKTAIIKGKISITYEIPKQKYRKLPRAVGLKGMIQIIKREMVLSKILFRTTVGEAFYARTNDTETIRAYKPRRRVRSIVGWVLCFPGKTAYASTFSIRRKFTGHKKLLMRMAFKMAQVKPAGIEGLLPEFTEEFEVMSADIPNSRSLVGKQFQRVVLKYKDYMPEGVKLNLNDEGIWMTGEEWLNKKQAEQMVKLCDQLILELRKEVSK